MAFTNLPTGLQSWLTFGLTLYSTLQPDADGTLGSSAAPPPSNNTLRYNQIQAIGTHNSYHVTPDDAILTFLTRGSTQALLGSAASEQIPSAWEATQAVLSRQIRNYGIRQVELDVYPDPEGGLFAGAAARKLAGENGFLDVPALRQPGWKVLHVPDIDFNTTCWTFVEGLQTIKSYSDANPYHEPIAIYVEFKTDDLADYIGPIGAQLGPIILNATSTPGPDTFVTVRNITASDVLDLHEEILSVFDGSDIITPDQLRGNDTARVRALAAAGAHFISTDFPSPPTYFDSSYQVRLPTAFVCNPVTTGTGLGDLADTLGTTASSSGVPSDDTPQCA